MSRNLFLRRPVLSVVFCLGVLGVLSLLGLTYQIFAHQRSFPGVLWLGGIEWFWCTWLAGKYLFQPRPPAGGPQRKLPDKIPPAHGQI
jgi:hypothetical protein